MNDVEIQLSDQPDGFGFLYGKARISDAVVRVNILPPEHLWQGDIRLDDPRPDPTHWQVFADGNLIARIEGREDAGPALVPLLTSQ